MEQPWTIGSFISALNSTNQEFEQVLRRNPDYYSHIVDFLHPPTIHTILIRARKCASLFEAVDAFVKRNRLMDHRWVKHLFVASRGSQAYPLHQHGLQNENLILVLEGRKHVVVAPPSSAGYLYEAPELALSEMGDRVFFANLFEPDLDTQPHLRYARAMEGVVGKHELIYIPANTVHGVRNLESIMAVAWHMNHGEVDYDYPAGAEQLLLAYPSDCSHIEEGRDFKVNADCSPLEPQPPR